MDFTIQQTPYSSYVTIRRKLQKNVTSEALNVVIENSKKNNNENIILELKEKLKAHENEKKKHLSQNKNLNEELRECTNEICIVKREC